MICTRCWQALWFEILLKCEILRPLVFYFDFKRISTFYVLDSLFGNWFLSEGYQVWRDRLPLFTSGKIRLKAAQTLFSIHKALLKNEDSWFFFTLYLPVSLLSVCCWGRETKFKTSKLKISGNFGYTVFSWYSQGVHFSSVFMSLAELHLYD